MLRRNILIFHAGALGDFVLSWPLAVALGRLHPQSRVIYVVPSRKGRLAEQVLRVEWTDAEAGWHHLYGDPRQLPERPARMLAGAHSVYSFSAGDETPWRASVKTLAPGADVLLLRARPPKDFDRHASAFLLDELSARGVVRTAVEQILATLATKGIGTALRGGGDVLLHPGSGGADKCWPADRFVELARRLAVDGHSVRFLIGEVERERWEPAAIRALAAAAAPVAHPPTYADLARELSTARAFVGNDSGPGHLAGIMGVPTLSLFGPTDPTVWRPLGPRVTTLRAASIAALPIDAAHDAVRRSLTTTATPPPPPAAPVADE